MFTDGNPLTHRLVVERLFAVVEGVVVERVHQVRVDVTEEHSHLGEGRKKKFEVFPQVEGNKGEEK